MNLYRKLSLEGINKNKSVYIPYILAFSFLVMSFSSLISLATMTGLEKEYGMQTIQYLLEMGTFVLFVFTVQFLYYCDGFLMEKRSEEYGLYGVLGLDKKQILKIVCLDSLIVYAVGLLAGIFASVLFYKLEEQLLLKTIKVSIETGFLPTAFPILVTIAVFTCIELLILLGRAYKIKKLGNLELIKAKRMHKKSSIKIGISALISVGLIGTGYYLALNTKNPLQSLQIFFIATLLVVLGTFVGFGAITEVVIGALKKNKKFYYRPQNFTSISGIVHRIRQNANGLASITIMSCAAIVLLGSAFSIYWSGDKILKGIFPRDIIYSVSHKDYSQQEVKEIKEQIERGLEKGSYKKQDYQKIEYKMKMTEIKGEDILFVDSFNSATTALLVVESENKNLKPDEVVAYSKKDTPDTLNISGKKYKVVEKKKQYENEKALSNMTILGGLVLEVGDLDSFDLGDAKLVEFEMFNVDGDPSLAIKDIKSSLSHDIQITGYTDAKAEFMTIFGALMFVGTFLGFVFIVGTALIIYYKQLQEGYESKENFNIMRRVGMTENEIKKSIKSQVWMVFLLPPAVALVHMIVASFLINDLFLIIGMTNTMDKATSFGIVFVMYLIIYFTVYKITSKAYYKIISEK